MKSLTYAQNSRDPLASGWEGALTTFIFFKMNPIVILQHYAKLCKSRKKYVVKTSFDDAKISLNAISTQNQYKLGQYGQDDGGHSQDQPGAEGKDAVFLSIGILLVTTGTTCHDK